MRGILALIVLIVAEVTSVQVVAETPIRLPDCVDALEQIAVLNPKVRAQQDIDANQLYWLVENTGTVTDPDLVPASHPH